MLKVEGLQAKYGRSQVLFDIDLEVGEGEIVTLLGRNGMGKTTTIRSVMGLTPPAAGSVSFGGQAIAGRTPEAIARGGIGLVPEGRQVFPLLTVYENLVATAANRLKRPNPWTLTEVFQMFPRLQERRNQFARTLSGGEQQMLAIARALMTNPQLLILDEATEGLAPIVRAEIWNCISVLKSRGHSILIVDKNLSVLKRIANRHFVIEKGRTVWRGTGEDLERDITTVNSYIALN
jgi:branched-chain amino acid transport system ATP-binding protein